MNLQELQKQRDISNTFMDYGWFVAPYLIMHEFKKVEEAADFIAQNPPQNDHDRKDIEDRIYHSLKEPVFNSGYRARATWYGNQLNHLKDFNHLYESAIFSYYKREYAPAVLSLLTALEGVMLSFYGYDINTGATKPNIPDLIRKIRQTKSGFPPGGDMDTRHDIYRDILVKFLEDWIYKKTTNSDFSLSVLNRHYVLHGMEPGNFYRPQDLHRLILAFDLLIEFFNYPQKLFLIFTPDPGKDAFIDARRDYYQALSLGTPTAAESWKIERTMLNQHAKYVEPEHDPNFAESFASHMELMNFITDLAKKARGQK